ncbi:tRNA (guanine(46)-N(7))-methyltransferase TrmB [Propionivibrio limicola]|uniref:tRNA (guanine(46)-N(7))-methyltransferase TrmB n=1 Tax=Propionivibrio limicola TaxID=167645 RepID=UPI001FE32E1D|nr:SAM-dependent methyltransferase [Propionivibrio limicola]
MYANSRIPTSAQTGIHDHLPVLLERHRSAPFRKPYADYNRVAFEESFRRWQKIAPAAPLILDSCCGVGESSVALAKAYPNHYVIGVDQSASRLSRNSGGWPGAADLPENLDLVRADLVDFWRLMRDAGLRLDRHYLLYPNPWPKIGHLSRRWHGHPVFSDMLALGGVLECRSNWPIYVEEFCFAVHFLTQKTVTCEPYQTGQPLTPFERKYLDSGHPLFRAIVHLG